MLPEYYSGIEPGRAARSPEFHTGPFAPGTFSSTYMVY